MRHARERWIVNDCAFPRAQIGPVPPPKSANTIRSPSRRHLATQPPPPFGNAFDGRPSARLAAASVGAYERVETVSSGPSRRTPYLPVSIVSERASAAGAASATATRASRAAIAGTSLSCPVRTRTNPTPRPSGPSAVRGARGAAPGTVPAWSNIAFAGDPARGADDGGHAQAPASASRSTRRPARAGRARSPRISRPSSWARPACRACGSTTPIQGADVVLDGIEEIGDLGPGAARPRSTPRTTPATGPAPEDGRALQHGPGDRGRRRPRRRGRPQPLRATPSESAPMTFGELSS